MDKIRTHSEGDRQFRECVSCGFEDVIDSTGQITELTTRVTPKQKPRDPQTQPLKFFDRPPKKKPKK